MVTTTEDRNHDETLSLLPHEPKRWTNLRIRQETILVCMKTENKKRKKEERSRNGNNKKKVIKRKQAKTLSSSHHHHLLA